MAQLLLDAGADPLGTTIDCMTPLHACCRTGAQGEACMRLLLRVDAVASQLDILNSNGDAPIHLCVKHGSPVSLRMLLDAGAKVNFLDLGDNSPIELAIKAGNKERIAVLKEFDAKPHKKWNVACKMWEADPTKITASFGGGD